MKREGTVWATGENSNGQLGDSSSIGRISFGRVAQIKYECQSWCASHNSFWQSKCTWPDCAGCYECLSQESRADTPRDSRLKNKDMRETQTGSTETFPPLIYITSTIIIGWSLFF